MMQSSTPHSDPGSERPQWRTIAVGLVFGIVYGLIGRLIFGLNITSSLFSTLSGAFLIGIPLVLGALVVYLSPKQQRTSWGYAAFAPLLPGAAFLLVVAVIGWEAFICMILAAPIFLAANLVGGLIMATLVRTFNYRRATRETRTYAMAILLVLPYIASPVESQIRVTDSFRTVRTKLIVNATPEVIWQQIIAVPLITDSEQRPSLFQIVGLPRPLEATLTGEGVGAVRQGIFNNGMRFIENVIVWEPPVRVKFTIEMDERYPLPEPFDKYFGAPFELIDAEYSLEPLPDGSTLLHLTSTERVTTPINFYSGWWSDVLMADLQYYILEIVKARAEAEYIQTGVRQIYHARLW